MKKSKLTQTLLTEKLVVLDNLKKIEIKSVVVSPYSAETELKNNIFTLDKKVKPKTKKSNENLTTAFTAEQYFVTLLKTFDSVENVEKDLCNSKFDIYYTLKNENFRRGLQVKAITKNTSRENGYRMHLGAEYPIGMLIVGINMKLLFGVAYLYSEEYNQNMGNISLNASKNGIFSKLVKLKDDFNEHLESMLSKGIIVTDEVFIASIPPKVMLEYKSIERFKLLCDVMKWNMIRHQDNASVIDLYLNNFKVQMKFASNPSNVKKGNYFYTAGNRSYNRQNYKQGDNDFYVVEIGEKLGEFIIIPEQKLIEIGYIATDTQAGMGSFHVFAYDYIEKKKATMIHEGRKRLVVGNWSVNKDYWFSTEQGYLGSLKFDTLEEYYQLIS